MPQLQSPPNAQAVIDGRTYLYFAGTGYFGLHGHPALATAAAAAMQKYGMASGTSRGGIGNAPPMLEAERLAAEWFGHEASFCYSSGFVGAGIFCDALRGTFDVILTDEIAHYAVTDAAAQTGVRTLSFKHRDANDLRRVLQSPELRGKHPLVMSDGVFASGGAVPPADEYVRVLEQHGGGTIYLDDAHAVGTIGDLGRGAFEYCGLDGRWNVDLPQTPLNPGYVRLYASGTLSKAIGAYGGIIAGSQALIDTLKGGSHFFRGASPPPIPAVAAAARAFELLAEHPGWRKQLRANVVQLKSGLRNIGLQADETPVPIVALELGTSQRMLNLQKSLMEAGIFVSYFPVYPGLGPAGGLRLAVFATHTSEMIDELLAALRRLTNSHQ